MADLYRRTANWLNKEADKKDARKAERKARQDKYKAGTDTQAAEQAKTQEKQAQANASAATGAGTATGSATVGMGPAMMGAGVAGNMTKEQEKPEETKTKKYEFSPYMFNDFTKYGSSIFKGRDITAGERDNKEQLHMGMAQRHQKAEEDAAAIAHRNERVEGDKDAVSQAASESSQNVNNLGATAGAAQAASQRTKRVGDYQAHRQRADAARQEATENAEKRFDDLQAGNETRALGKAADFKWNQRNRNNAISGYLSLGGNNNSISVEEEQKTRPEETKETPPETPTEDTPPEESSQGSSANVQRVINFMLGNSDGANPDNSEAELFNIIANKYDVKAVPIEQASSYYPPNVFNNVNAWEGYYKSRSDQYGTAENKAKALSELINMRTDNPNKNLTRGKGNEQSNYATISKGVITGVTADRLE